MTLSMAEDTIFSPLHAQTQARETQAGACVLRESLFPLGLEDKVRKQDVCRPCFLQVLRDTLPLFLVATAFFPKCLLPVKTAAMGLGLT